MTKNGQPKGLLTTTVGSFAKPDYLAKARTAHAASKLSDAELSELEKQETVLRGRWEKETLVVDVTSFNDQTWFDRAGNFHSDALHVVERYTAISPGALQYEATIEDPKVFTRPWKMSMPLYRWLCGTQAHAGRGSACRA